VTQRYASRKPFKRALWEPSGWGTVWVVRAVTRIWGKWEKGKEDSGTGNLALHTAGIRVGEAFRTRAGQKDYKDVGRIEHRLGRLPYGANAFSIL
jgi:hypothetical protein